MATGMTTTRSELLEASDQEIDEAISYADPMALRGLLYQLTADERVAATRVTGQVGIDAAAVADQEDVALLRAKAADFLKCIATQVRGRSVRVIPIDCPEAWRWPRAWRKCQRRTWRSGSKSSPSTRSSGV